jgi:putative transposase
MVRKGYALEQIIYKLREAEVLLSKGNTIGIVSKKIGISDFTYYRWRKEYGSKNHDLQNQYK